jgi:two-component system chemotaxis sensor kinase CheA
MEIDLQQFYQIFFQESDEHIQNLESSLLKLEETPDDKELLNSIFRSAHTIKGTSGSIGFTAVSEFTHLLETLLDKMRNWEVAADRSLIDLILKSVDCIKGMITTLREGREVDEGTADSLRPRLEEVLGGQGLVAGGQQPETQNQKAETLQPKTQNPKLKTPAAKPVDRLFDIRFEPDPLMMRKGMDPLNLIRALGALGEVLTVRLDTSKLPPLEEMDPERLYLSWDILLLTREGREAIESVFEFVREDSLITVTLLTPASELDFPQPEEHDIEAKEVREAIKDLDSRSPKLIGNLFLADGSVSEEQLAGALAEQLKQKKIGEVLVEQKVISEEKLKDTLKKQEVIKKTDVPTIRVDVEKVDKLMNLVGELVIIQSMLSQVAEGFTPETFNQKLETLKKAANQLERNCREIQERVMSIRMLPIGNVFNRFPRVVRDISAERGKKAALLISGEDTELDKTLIEKIADPLTHLIRNSVDHGIEPPEERVAAGKPEIGKIRLSAFHQGGNVIVAVEDDGKGLDKGKITGKAIEKGLIKSAEGMSDQEIYNLIFLPGFSTAEKVTEVSGRGVGMDVVKRNIEGIGGSVLIETEEGKHTRFTIKIPLTLAIIDGLTVSVGKEMFIIPITSIVESKRPRMEEVKHVKGEGEVVNFRGHYVPLVRLHRFFGIEPKKDDPTKALVVVVNAENRDYALLVDDLIGQQQAVIKSIGEGFEGVPGIAGATIQGSGEVALITDVAGIVKRAFK